jgi:uncharacterized membrane protein
LSRKKKSKKSKVKKSHAGGETPVREKPEGRKKKKELPTKKREDPNWLLIALAGAGMALTAYLTVIDWLGQAPLFCEDGSTCDIVQQSRWGTFLGLPTAFWGFLTYTSLLYIGVNVRKPESHWKSAWTVSMIGLGYSVYLITISLLVIEAACAYCIASFMIMAVIFGVVTFQRPKDLPRFNFAAFARQTVIIAAVIVGGMHLHYSGVFYSAAGPEDPYLRGLAVHLTRQDAVFYGAYW